MSLPDGRVLEYTDLGDPAGAPLMFFHGTPATGGQGAVLAGAAKLHGIRLITPSRPGYGASTLSPPGLSPTAADALELAGHLGLDRFAVLGTSGGGPFSLAVAAAAPDRLSAVAVHASPGCYADVKPEVLEADDRRALDLAASGDADEAMRVMDALGDAGVGNLRGLSPEEFSEAMAKMAPPGGSWLDGHPDLQQAFRSDFRRAITTSSGMSRDNLSWLRDWDIDLSAVTVPVDLVYGDADRMAEVAHGEWLRARLPSSELHVVPGDHTAVVFGAAADSFAAIASARS